MIEFAETMLGVELLPWQKWWLLHALELLPGGGFRYRVLVTLVARQSGKTTLIKILALAFMYLGRVRLVLGLAQSLDIAKESWSGAVEMAEGDPELRAEIDDVRKANGQEELRLCNGARYRIAAATRKAGRGLSVDLLIVDEVREHRDWASWGAVSKTTMARPNALTVAISNAGDDESVVLNQLRDTALAGTDPSIFLAEWSAEEGCELDDREAWAQANPGLGYTITEQALASALATDPPAVFRTECLCQKVDQLDGAIDLGAWKACRDASMTLDLSTQRPILCADVAPDGGHVTLVAAAEKDGVVRVGVVQAWSSTEDARRDLPALRDELDPLAGAWLPNGPAAALAPLFRAWGWIEIKGAAVSEACQGFADLVRARRVRHSGDPLLDAHVAGASKYHQGDGWRFVRKGAGHVDAAYSAAGATYIALTLPEEEASPWFGVV
ncbi:terminase [Amycolatopsis sp. NPDC006131]|uniref:terminase n=1 Tax=Amycolatopsis sp. NPDC006131 TaxID=3156731 RepID=UPI0033B5C3ED